MLLLGFLSTDELISSSYGSLSIVGFLVTIQIRARYYGHS
jgi:hypothetical protein